MKIGLQHVYWMLLFTSVVSSALLFLIVASESVQNNKFIGPDRNQATTEEENASIYKDTRNQFKSDKKAKINFKISSSLRKTKGYNYEDIQSPLSASFDTFSRKEESKTIDGVEILKESLTQQPNLSQGISDGGQPVVLTLVDQDATLKELATRRATDYNKQKSQEANVSSDENQSTDGILRISKLIHDNKDTDSLADSDNDTVDKKIYYNNDILNEADPVVVVRAERKSHFDINNGDFNKNDEDLRDNNDFEVTDSPFTESTDDDIEKIIPQSSDPPTVAPDLNENAARSKLINAGDEGSSTAALIDSLVTQGPSDPHEEIPSFNEWAQKRLEEAEKKKTGHPNASVQTANGGTSNRGLGGMRRRSKNYASPDCGAKIVAANPESRSARNILVSTRDEYMLNTCKTRIWFVVQLCEAIQAKKIELANFELFSSSPKDISVYVSDRFPTRDWSNVGHFTARDERDVQSFNLQPQLFGRFIKVELHSHYGSEHFCPISLFRAYGTSEFEVLETESDHADSQRGESSANGNIAIGDDFEANDADDDEDSVFTEDDDEAAARNPPSGSIFGSARDAVLSIVRKAAEVLVKSSDLRASNNITKIQESIEGDVLGNETLDDCTTPVYNVACRDCDDRRFARVFQLISCKGHYLEALLDADFVKKTLIGSNLCRSSAGFEVLYDSEACSDGSKASNDKGLNQYDQARLLSAIFTPDHIIALCNVVAAKEQRLFANTSHQQRQNDTGANESSSKRMPVGKKEKKPSQSGPLETVSTLEKTTEMPVIKSKSDGIKDGSATNENIAMQIKPTKTAAPTDDAKKQSFTPTLESSKSQIIEELPTAQSESFTTSDAPVPTTKRQTSASQKHSQSEQTQASSTQEMNTGQGVQEKELEGIEKETKTLKTDDDQEFKIKNGDQQVKAKVDQQAKIRDQQQPDPDQKDQLNFEGFDFKDLDVENLPSNGFKSDSSVTQQTASAVPKESVFLRLSNRIKVLERNMSLSSQYLEELSRRYKKQVEEMQRTLERAMSAMSEESRKGEERENKRLEEVTTLRRQIDVLTHLLEDLYREKDAWSFRSLLSHVLFVLVDVIVVLFLLAYCRRNDDEYIEEEVINPRPARGRNYEIAKQNYSQMAKKTKKRRPSEIASQVSGNYEQLMIEDTGSQVGKASRRKRRKKDTLVMRSASIKECSGSRDQNRVILHSRSASASNAIEARESDLQLSRPDSAPVSSISYFREEQQPITDNKIQILTINVNSELADSEKKQEEIDQEIIEDDTFEQVDSSSSSIRSMTKKLSSPSFMRTALGSRSKRSILSGGKKTFQSLDESNTLKPNQQSSSELELNNTTNGHVEESDGSTSTTPSKKEKKTSGFRRMVRKFF